MDVFIVKGVGKLAYYCLGLRYLFRREPIPFHHIEKIGVATKIELISPIDCDTALPEQIRQCAMDNRRSHLTLDVIADDRQSPFLKALSPTGVGGEKDRYAIDVSTGSRRCDTSS